MDSGAARQAETGKLTWHYERRRPERTLLYQLVAEHYPRFLELLSNQGRSLPHYVQREFDVAPVHPYTRDISESFHVRFPQVRYLGTRFPAGAVPGLPQRTLGGFQLVAPAHPCARDINAIPACHVSGC